MTAEPASINARDLSRRAASVLDRIEHGERLIVTRDGEPIAEIIPIDRAQRTLARWAKEGLIAGVPAPWATKSATVANAVRGSLAAEGTGQAATDALLAMRENERA